MKRELQELGRRELLLGGASLFGGAALWPGQARASAPWTKSFLAPEDGGRPRTLILVQLFGGNDPLSTVVPYADDAYHRSRPNLRIPEKELLRLDDYRGFNPVLENLNGLWKDGQLAIVEGVGYPQPSLSHFKSLDIWHAARTEGSLRTDGWIGRLRDAAWPKDPRGELVAHAGEYVPNSISSSLHPPLTYQTPESYLWIGEARQREACEEACRSEEARTGNGRDAVLSRLRKAYRQAQATSPKVLEALAAYDSGVEYPEESFGNSMRSIAALIQANFPTRIYSVDIRNFDSHARQRERHDPLLALVDGGIGALLRDLKGTDAYDKTLIVAFSEFGRRVEENYSQGTDHGAGGTMFFLGPMVKGGLYGKHPSLTELDDDGNLVHNVDFRSTYATIIEDWFHVAQDRVLDEPYSKLSILKT